MYFQPIILSITKNESSDDQLNKYLQRSDIITPLENIIKFNSTKSSIGIQNIANLNKEIYRKNDKVKILILDESEKMTEEAQNSFLKTLEEPNENLLIILITTNIERLLPTIRSRCIEVNQNIKMYFKENDLFSNFLNSNYIKRKSIIENITKEDNSREFALDLILYIINNIKVNQPKLGDEIIHIYKSIKQGSNLKLALENISILLT